MSAVSPSISSTISTVAGVVRGVPPGEPRLERVPLAAAAAIASSGTGLMGDELLRRCPHLREQEFDRPTVSTTESDHEQAFSNEESRTHLLRNESRFPELSRFAGCPVLSFFGGGGI